MLRHAHINIKGGKQAFAAGLPNEGFDVVCMEARQVNADLSTRATAELIARHLQTVPFSMQLLGRKTRSAGQEKPETGNLPDQSGSTPKKKLASLKLETLHETGGQLVGASNTAPQRLSMVAQESTIVPSVPHTSTLIAPPQRH